MEVVEAEADEEAVEEPEVVRMYRERHAELEQLHAEHAQCEARIAEELRFKWRAEERILELQGLLAQHDHAVEALD